jgi:tetratricopeptide (TPR) repeat protein
MAETSVDAALLRGRRLRRWGCATAVLALLALSAALGVFWRLQRPEARFQRALAALDAKQFDQVQRELDDLERVEGYDAQRKFLQGAILLHQGKPFAALDQFGGSVDDPQLRVRTLVLSGQALYQAGRFQNAVRLLHQAIGDEPNNVDAHRWLASAYYDMGMNEDAQVHLVEVARLDPRDPRPHRLIGLIQKDFEGYDSAVAAYEESLRRDPDQPDHEKVRLELAECQVKLRQYDRALQTLSQCSPSEMRTVLEAECLYSTGKVDESRQLLQEVLNRSPENLAALLLLGTVELESRNMTAALKSLNQAVTAWPKDYTARFRLAQAYRRAGDEENAALHAAEAEKLKAIRVEFSELHHVAADEPENIEVRRRLGELALALDRPDLARVWYQAALAIDPNDAISLEALGRQP